MTTVRYDRYGDTVELEEPAPLVHVCDAGWCGEDADGRPVPCLVCRPHLVGRW